MAGDTNKVDTAQLVSAASDIGNIKKNITTSVESVNAVFRKMFETNAGKSSDALSAVVGQLKKSSAEIINMLARYETVLKEIAGIYDTTENKTSNAAGKLKFGGLR